MIILVLLQVIHALIFYLSSKNLKNIFKILLKKCFVSDLKSLLQRKQIRFLCYIQGQFTKSKVKSNFTFIFCQSSMLSQINFLTFDIFYKIYIPLKIFY